MTGRTLTNDIPRVYPGAASRRSRMSTWRLAWRNLWRNRRRTWLTAGGIAFAVWMLVFAMSMQDGSFGIMVDNVARLLTGHVQVQHDQFQDDPALEHTLTDVEALMTLAQGQRGVSAVLPRVQAFALASVGERSFGAQIVGVDFTREQAASSLPGMVVAGRYLQGPGEAFVGAGLARNLGLSPGDELVLLGTALEGGVAATVAEVVGLFDTGQPALDRAFVQIPLADFRVAWNLPEDQVHVLALVLDHVSRTPRVAPTLAGPGRRVLEWTDLMPEARQTIEMKKIGAQLFFAMIAIIVTFSVVNTFLMTVFERTPEFGMLMALGMRPGAIIRQLSGEAFWMCALGVFLGLSLSGALIGWLSGVGLPLPADAGEVLARYNMPDRMFPDFSWPAALVATLVMFVGTQLAAWISVLRVWRLQPASALRAQE